jgi:DNA invertase Pin-like site-specific DNA recombinase
MRVAIYARVSTDRQEPLNQLTELRAYCARKEWEIAAEYVDEDVSGTGPKPQLDALLTEAHRKRFDLVAFWALDRLTRAGGKDALDILYRLSASGVDFVSYQEPYLTSLGPFRDMVVGILGTIANLESRRISERIKSGLARARSQGRKIGRPSVATPGMCAEIVQKRNGGLPWGQVAREYHLPRSTARRLYHKGLAISDEGHGRDEPAK